MQCAMRPLCPLLLALALSSASYADSAPASRNLIDNGGFEADVLGNLSMWSTHAAADSADAVRFFATNADAHSGRRSFAIANLKPNDAWAIQWVRVKPDTCYRLSCWIQARSVASQAIGANLSVLGSARAAGDLRDTKGRWQRVEMYGKTGHTQRALGVLVRLGFYRSLATGLALFDDVSLEELPGPLAAAGKDMVNFSANEYLTNPVLAPPKVSLERPPARVPLWLFVAAMAVLAAAALSGYVPSVARRWGWGGMRIRERQAGPYRGVEHRSSSRSTLRAEITVRRSRRGKASDVFRFPGRNISDGGIFLECRDPSVLKLNDEVRLEIVHETARLTLGRAVVARVHSVYSRSGNLISGGFALRFLTGSRTQLKERRKAFEVGASAPGRPG